MNLKVNEINHLSLGVLLVCPSEYWSTIERTALRDAKILHEQGHDVYLYCLQDSFLDLKAKNLGITTIYHSGRISTSIFKWPTFKQIPTLIDQHELKIVQCYDVHLLWPIAFFLRKRSLVSLVFSHNVEISKLYRQFWYKPLIKRIDTTLLPSREMREGVVGSLGISTHKIDYCGLGVADEKFQEESTSNQGHFLKNFSEDWKLGCYVGAHEKSIDFLLPVFHALKVLVEKRPCSKGVKCVLISDKPWDEHLIRHEIGHYLVDSGLDQHVLFESKTPVVVLQRYLDLWIGVRSFEAIDDYMITALLSAVPVVMTRSTATMEILRRRPLLGYTYMRGDARELRSKISVILDNYESIKSGMTNEIPELMLEFGLETYREQLIHVFDKSLNKRLRFFARKKL
jgi:hypothetical protein